MPAGSEGPSLAERVREAVRRAGGPLCVGLDPDPDLAPVAGAREPAEACLALCRRAVRATRGLAAAYKANAAFFEVHGGAGLEVLRALRHEVPEGALAILDAKRGDVASSARLSARWAFEVAGYDAVTLNPLLGLDSVEPFLGYTGRGAFLLLRTSNPGARDVQDLDVGGTPFYLALAERVASWAREHRGLGAVVGATWPEELARVRRVLGDEVPILVPGIGAQGGSAAGAVKAAGSGPLLLSASRAILYAGDGSEAAMRAAAERLRAEALRA